MDKMKRCPFCYKEIEKNVARCPFCYEMLHTEKKIKWYFSLGFLIFNFLSLPLSMPIMLPLVWLHPTYSKRTKWVLSIIILILGGAIGFVFWQSLMGLFKYYEVLGGNYQGLGL